MPKNHPNYTDIKLATKPSTQNGLVTYLGVTATRKGDVRYPGQWISQICFIPTVQSCCGLGELLGFDGAVNLLEFITPAEFFAELRNKSLQWNFIYTLTVRQLDNPLHKLLLQHGAIMMGEPWQNEQYANSPDKRSHILRTFRFNMKAVVDKLIGASGDTSLDYPMWIPIEDTDEKVSASSATTPAVV